MTLEEFAKKLKSFDCQALQTKPVVHRFVSSNLYSYIEEITDVAYDAKRGEIVLESDEPKQVLWDDKVMVRCDK